MTNSTKIVRVKSVLLMNNSKIYLVYNRAKYCSGEIWWQDLLSGVTYTGYSADARPRFAHWLLHRIPF